jgi:hypothetical protein
METNIGLLAGYREFRLRVVLPIIFLGPGFGFASALPWIFPDLPQDFLFLLWVYLGVYAIEVIAGFFLLRTGYSAWFAFFISLLMVTIGFFGLSLLLILPKVESTTVYRWIGVSWFFLFPLMWWWGSRVYCSKGEIKDAVLKSKRIDIEAGTYSPYLFPDDLFEAGWARSAVALSATAGGIFIGLGVYLGHVVSTRSVDGELLLGAAVGYLLVILSVTVISAIYHEWLWIRKWEKKTGRKMYIKEIIEWKRLQANRKVTNR